MAAGQGARTDRVVPSAAADSSDVAPSPGGTKGFLKLRDKFNALYSMTVTQDLKLTSLLFWQMMATLGPLCISFVYDPSSCI